MEDSKNRGSGSDQIERVYQKRIEAIGQVILCDLAKEARSGIWREFARLHQKHSQRVLKNERKIRHDATR